MENKEEFNIKYWLDKCFGKDENKKVPNYVADSSSLDEIDDFIQKEQIQQKIREAAEIAFGQPLYPNTSGISVNSTTGNISYNGSTGQTLTGTGQTYQYPYTTLRSFNPQLAMTPVSLTSNTASSNTNTIPNALKDLYNIMSEQREQIKQLTEAVNSLLEQKIKNFNDK